MADPQTEIGPHLVRIQHDAESHQFEDCHDDCTASLICPGVTDACRVWDECGVCRAHISTLGDGEYESWNEQMHEETEAHGEDHMWFDGVWMTPTSRCMTQACDEHDAYYLVADLADGEHPVELEWEEGYVSVRALAPEEASRG